MLNKEVNHDNIDGDERHEKFVTKIIREYLMDIAEKNLIDKQRTLRIKKYKRYAGIINSPAENVHKNIAIDKLIESEYEYFWCSELRNNLKQMAVKQQIKGVEKRLKNMYQKKLNMLIVSQEQKKLNTSTMRKVTGDISDMSSQLEQMVKKSKDGAHN